MNRKKRLRKGIDSLEEEISRHEAKMAAAKRAGNEGLNKILRSGTGQSAQAKGQQEKDA